MHVVSLDIVPDDVASVSYVHRVTEPRQPVLGYAMVVVAAALFGFNGAVSKVALTSGLSSLRLTEARSAGACIALTAIALARDRSSLRVRWGDLPRLAIFGVVGVAWVQLFYFLAIDRLPIGIALLIQYIGPVLVAIWAGTVGGRHVGRRIWLALALSLTGLTLMVQLWRGVTLDGLGVTFALIAAVVFAAYLLLAEREVQHREAIPLLAWGFFFATVFWTIVQPWWSFPASTTARTVTLQGHLASYHLPVWALVLWVIVFGSAVPFALIVGALRHITATQVGITAMLEPVVATVAAWVWLEESLSAVQLAGAAVVLCGIGLAQTARASPSA
jgi:drug/metabolite transporter (DMT)-like permease